MREAFRINKEPLYEAAGKTGLQIILVFIFRNGKGANVRRVRYTNIESDVKDVVSKIISTILRLQ